MDVPSVDQKVVLSVGQMVVPSVGQLDYLTAPNLADELVDLWAEPLAVQLDGQTVANLVALLDQLSVDQMAVLSVAQKAELSVDRSVDM